MNVGIVGAGLIGRRRAEVLQRCGQANLVIVADVDLGRARDVATKTNCCVATTRWEDVVEREDVDVVIVSTPNRFLAPISIAAIEKGKHVLCEKPLGRNPEESREIVERAIANRVKIKTGFNHRYHPAIRKAKQLADEGTIGELNFIRCRYGHGGRAGYEKEWRTNKEIAGGGELLDQGIHAIDLFRWFIGDLTEVAGFKATRFWDIHPLEDNAFALFRNEKGQIASLHASWTQWKNIFSFEIFGQDGHLTVEGLGGSYGKEHLTIGRRSPISVPPTEEHIEFPEDDKSWDLEWDDFSCAIKEDREPLANGYDGWEAVRMVHAVYESSERGCFIKL